MIWIAYDCGGHLVNGFLERINLAGSRIVTKGVVIDKKNFYGHNPVTQSFSYSYEFTVNGKNFTGNSGDSRYSVGDSVNIEYAASNPQYNRPLKTEN